MNDITSHAGNADWLETTETWALWAFVPFSDFQDYPIDEGERLAAIDLEPLWNQFIPASLEQVDELFENHIERFDKVYRRLT